MSKSKYILPIGILSLCLVSCTGQFDDMNTDPNKVTDEMLDYDNLRTGGAITAMEMDIIPCSDQGANEFQRAQNLAGDIFSGYMSASNNWNSSSNNTTYNLYFGNWNDVLFSVAYKNVIPQWQKLNNEKVKKEEPIAYAVGTVLKVASLSRVTDSYGPIPYSKIGEGLLVQYDSQEKVYEEMFKDLNEAIDIIEDFAIKNPNARPLKKNDIIFEGNTTKWAKYANSLKLRLAMRMAYVEPTLSQKYAEEAINSKLGVMTANDDIAYVHSANGIIVYNPLKVVWDMYNDTRMGATMESFLKGYNDPRMSAYFSPSKFDDGKIHGIRNGVVWNNIELCRKASTPNIFQDTPVLLMSAAEVFFLRAEAALRGWNANGDAKDLYENGVKLSFQQHNVSGGSYLTTEAKPADFVDKVGDNNINAMTQISPVYNNEASFEENLERIITQKWLAMFPEGLEAWTEYRRTGYPKIFPVVKNFSGGIINTNKQVRRIIFPRSEYDNNNTNVKQAIQLMNGPDTGNTRLWWDTK